LKTTKWFSSTFWIFAGITLLSSCYRVPEQIEPKVDYCLQDRYFLKLPSPFTPLTDEELSQEWSKEYRIAMGFAKELDLYQAITAFKRALYLIPASSKERKKEVEYEILLCYYMGRKFSEAVSAYDHSDLRFIDTSFPACEDLLIILFDCYTKLGDTSKANLFFQHIQTYYPEAAKKLELCYDLQMAYLPGIEQFASDPTYPYLSDFLTSYEEDKKSIAKAQTLNAIFPGAGYLYIGQKQSALTATLLNGLFIGATYYFFQAGNIPAGAIFTAFEAGWYFGGIYGVGEEAKFYNERMYEKHATPMMNQNKLFPAFMIGHAF
jgi:tetratricopeptide (TPR) repeat protein